MGYGRKKQDLPLGKQAQALVIMGFAFILGALAGSYISAHTVTVREAELRAVLSEGAAFSAPAFRSALLLNAGLVAVVFLGGLSRYGLIAVPACLCFRGYIVAAEVTSFIKVFSYLGYLPAFFASFISSFFVVFSLFAGAVQALTYSRRISDKGGRAFVRIDQGYYMSMGICLLIVTVSCVVQCYISPVFVRILLAVIK